MNFAPALVALLRDPDLRAEIVAIFRDAAPPAASAPAVHMTRGEYARSRRISGATVARLVSAGMPVIAVGTTDRIDPVAADEWRRSREPATTTPARRVTAADDVDVSSLATRAGLRAVRGGR